MKSTPVSTSSAVFLDRDGVLIEDVDLLDDISRIRILPGVPDALQRLGRAGFRLIVATNQPIIARGIVSEQEVDQINREIAARLERAGAPVIDRFYVCPHHPKATIAAYRVECQCRKPRPGLL